jgi:phosphoglycolate phosphatase-like HAD superfamily hydrolase
MLTTAAERCGLGAGHRAIMIGDTQADVQLGRAYGAKTVWCAWGYADALQDPADADAHEPADLLRIVNES